MTTIVSGAGRLVVGVSGSPGSLCALRYALVLTYRLDVPLLAALAWLPPGGEQADRRDPSPELRRVWTDAARKRLTDALDAACGGVPTGVDIAPVIIRGAAGPALVDIADSDGDVLGALPHSRGACGRQPIPFGASDDKRSEPYWPDRRRCAGHLPVLRPDPSREVLALWQGLDGSGGLSSQAAGVSGRRACRRRGRPRAGSRAPARAQAGGSTARDRLV
jgi:hypothetical protein